MNTKIMTRVLPRALVVLTLLGLVLPTFACGKKDDCPSGHTQVCNDGDSNNCLCAPNCSAQSDCQRYSLTKDGYTFRQGEGLNCDPTANACLPTTWVGDSVIDVSSIEPSRSP